VKDYDLPLRKAYVQALSAGSGIVYEGNTIPIFDSKMEYRMTENDISIRIAGVEGEDKGVKAAWMKNANITIDIVQRMKSATQLKVVDTISDLITQKLFPTPRTNTLQIETGFRLQCPKYRASKMFPLQTLQEGGWMLVKSLVFSNIIIQN
jgi:hypothetical protein